MVCDHCGSKTHGTGNSGCSKYCTLCKTKGHRQKSGSCPFRECSKCKAVGHSARECRPLTVMVCAHCGSKTHRTGSGNCSKYCAMCKTPGHRQKRGSCPFRECGNCKAVRHRHANVDHSMKPLRSWYVLTVALKRIERTTLAAQITARCAKHPVIDRSTEVWLVHVP